MRDGFYPESVCLVAIFIIAIFKHSYLCFHYLGDIDVHYLIDFDDHYLVDMALTR